MATTELSAKIPAFNPQKLTGRGRRRQRRLSPTMPEAAVPDAEVSFVQRDLAPILPRAKIAGALAMDEVLASVREAANWNARDTTRYAPSPAFPPCSSRSLMLPKARSILMQASKRGSSRKTSRCCPRPQPRSPAGSRRTNARCSSKKGDNIALHPARTRRPARRNQGDRFGAWARVAAITA